MGMIGNFLLLGDERLRELFADPEHVQDVCEECQEAGDEDVGYGPARAFLAAEVVQIARALEPIDRQQLMTRFDADAMNRLKIYPDVGSWAQVASGGGEMLDYYLGAFEAIKSLMGRGAAAGLGMLVWLA